MNLPISELIHQNLLSVVAGINSANGYNFDLIAERITTPENPRRHLLAIIVDTDPATPSGAQTQGRTTVDQMISIEVYFIPDSNDDTPLGRYMNLTLSDVTRAVMEDINRDGNAINTTPEQPELIANEKGETQGIAINFTVTYRYKTTDPTSL